MIKRIHDWIHVLMEKLAWLPPLIGRLTIGGVFTQTGWGKIHNLPKVIAFFTELHIPAPQIQAPLAAYTELICGTAVLLGLATRLTALPLIVTMIVAILTAKLKEFTGLSDLLGAEEYLYIVILLWLSIKGAGSVSIDRFLCRRCAEDPPDPR